MAEVSSPGPAVFTVGQAHGITEGKVLGEPELRRCVLQAAEFGRKGQHRQTKIIGQLRYAIDSQLAFNIRYTCELVCGIRIAAVVVETQRVQEQSFHRCVTGIRVVVVSIELASQRRKGIKQIIVHAAETKAAIDAL